MNDCQDPEVVSESLDQYQPPDRTSVHILAFVAALLSLSSICIHAFVYPGVGRFSRRLQNIELKAKRQSYSLELGEDISKDRKQSNVSSISNDIDNIQCNGELNYCESVLHDGLPSDAPTADNSDSLSKRQTDKESTVSVSMILDIKSMVAIFCGSEIRKVRTFQLYRLSHFTKSCSVV